MSAAPAAVIDALNSLLDAEQNSVFRFMGEGSPYLSRAAGEFRRPLTEIVAAGERRVLALAQTIDDLGGVPQPAAIQMEEQYLAFLTIQYLLPRLVAAKHQIIARYEQAGSALRAASAEVRDLLNAHLQQHRAELALLDRPH